MPGQAFYLMNRCIHAATKPVLLGQYSHLQVICPDQHFYHLDQRVWKPVCDHIHKTAIRTE